MKLALVHKHHQRGLALVVVLSILTLGMILVLALFSTTQTELKSAISSSHGEHARHQADLAINLVIGQLKRATYQDLETDGKEIWASQPGMVRQYREDGSLLAAHKLYSDQKMIETSETGIGQDAPPFDWNDHSTRYVDLNEPLVRQILSTGEARLDFPIIDPRSFALSSDGTSIPTQSVEGFSYTNKAKGELGSASEMLGGVVLPNGSNADQQRLPMPVEWLYTLKDGTLGYLDANDTFVGANGEEASAENPIVSRIAFWTDDESSKININTAGEGTYWDVPRLVHERDGDWALYQPMMHEYQRYPGHPATVSMSTVLFPGMPMNPPRTSAAFATARDTKETIYDLMPKILQGGSTSGSVKVPAGRNFSPIDFAKVQHAMGERLFATVDEYLFSAKVTAEGIREEIDFGSQSMWSGMPKAEVVNRLRFFLTTSSRSPETNPFGYPKIAIWPLSVHNHEDYRTVYDQTIARSSSLAGKNYFFTRERSHSDRELTDIVRNREIHEYLKTLTAEPIPGVGADFLTKYGDNREQILVSIFDYIRSTNLFDESLAEKHVGQNPTVVSGASGGYTNAYSSNGGLASKTFTPLRTSANAGASAVLVSWPGHGQVVPTTVDKAGGDKYRGLGRYTTISEVGLHFICTAQSTDRAGGMHALKLPTGKWDTGVWGTSKNWYSNFPPLTGANATASNNFYGTRYPTTNGTTGIGTEGALAGNNANHPGYNSRNWNWTLDRNQPLPDHTKRVQATFNLEWFMPSAGWTRINPDFHIEIDASGLTIEGRRMFPQNGGIIQIKPRHQLNTQYEIYSRGGTTAYRGFLQERSFPAVAAGINGFARGSLPADNIGANNYDVPRETGTTIENNHRYDLVSDFFDIPADGTIPFDGGKVIIRFKSLATGSEQVVQTIHLDFPSAAIPAPELVRKNRTVSPMVPAPYWWSFHFCGAIARNSDGTFPPSGVAEFGGRSRFVHNEFMNWLPVESDVLPAGDVNDNYRQGSWIVPEDSVQSLVPYHGDSRLIMARYNVPESEFVPHRLYGIRRMAHNIASGNLNSGTGIDYGRDNGNQTIPENEQFIYGVSYSDPRQRPDIPLPDTDGRISAIEDLNRFGDFDRGAINMQDGAYINKPDEGNTHRTDDGVNTIPYFTVNYASWTGGSAYFSPNRQVSSPGMFGSLPTGVFGSATTSGSQSRQGWRTLLFRPSTWKSGSPMADRHPGAPASLRWSNPSNEGFQSISLGGGNPADHLLMEYYWMPVVEPYAISQPGSTGGKINLNYQLAPFRHIRRATALAAAMKSEFIHSIPLQDGANHNVYPPGVTQHSDFWKESDNAAKGNKFWHRQIDVDATLKLFDERLASGMLFLYPSQICEMPLLPVKGGYLGASVAEKNRDSLPGSPPAAWATSITDHYNPDNPAGYLAFWNANASTAENLREKPYTNLYPKLTTRSNTFQVYVRSQIIKKARSSDPKKFNPDLDTITSEYRGSALIERYLDADHPNLITKDYALGGITSHEPLDHYHRFRVLNYTRFQ
jgi:uncharacterized protein (TIGR02600 family)